MKCHMSIISVVLERMKESERANISLKKRERERIWGIGEWRSEAQMLDL